MLNLTKDAHLFVFPHPDDEVFSCLALWRRMRERHKAMQIDAIWLTTGCPASGNFTRDDDYGTYRTRLAAEFDVVRQELRSHLLSHTYALQYAGRSLHVVASEAYGALQSLVRERGYRRIFCCPLEGAHPDHDMANALVGALRRADVEAFETFEYSSYHLGTTGQFVNNVFSGRGHPVSELHLDQTDVRTKQRFRKMYTAEPSLDEFVMRSEIFRPMEIETKLTAYDHRPVFYETWRSCVDSDDVAKELRRWADT